MKWVKDTQDNVPSQFKDDEAKEYVKKCLKEELNVEFDDVFSDWKEVPLGVASIGQVHKATLKETGQVVAVKLLCPGIEKRFRSDIRTLKGFCKLAMPQHVPAFDEIEKQFATEFDYRAEANNLQVIGDAIRPRWGRRVVIPRPVTQLCSKNILVMEFLDGVKFVDGVRQQYSRLAALQGKTLEELENERKDQIAKGVFKFESIEQSRKNTQKLKQILFWKDCLAIENIKAFAYNWTGGWIYGPVKYNFTELAIDLGETLELLCLVHGNELFEIGAFNGDCHPGNVLLLKDGRLGLIDYGQVKTMSVENRIKYAKLIIAHSRGDKQEIIRLHFQEIGAKTKRNDPEIGYLMSCFYNDRDTEDVCKGMNIASFVDWMEAQDPVVELPESFIMACRMNIFMRGIGKAFGLQLRMSKLWEKEAQAFLKSQNIDY
jgi:aarF domain-containing kinase